MKLLYFILLRISLAVAVILAVWAVFFYVTMIDEINDEVDDSLEDYTEAIMVRHLAGEQLPSTDNGSNNQYYIREVHLEYAKDREEIQYKDSMIYIVEKAETEPARILTTLFKDDNDNYFELTVSVPTIEKKDLKNAIGIWIIFLYVVLLFTIILIATWMFYRNMRPLYKLLYWLDSYQAGQKNTPLKNETKISEFRKLNDATIRYTERNEQLFEQQKQFIGNASHEIQTPLAICQNRLEMLMEDDSLSENQLGELMRTHQTLEHITKLNRCLLLLSKIDNRQFTETKELNLNTLLLQYIEDYKEVYEYRKISITVIEKDTLNITMNDSLAIVLLTNLLKNAYVHNVDNGYIRIEITVTDITFCNSGTHLLDDRIFERFYQGNKKEGSTGLGLAIVYSICKLQQLSIKYTFEEREHRFKVSVK